MNNVQKIWNKFYQDYGISQDRQEKFQKYFELIVQENQKYNITAITSEKSIVLDHFYDSLSLIKVYDLSKVTSLVDVGSGGGFPGVPLAIMNEHVTVHLIEVNQKKVHFLHLVKEALGLNNLTIHTHDWRTFLRTYNDPIDVVTARASLQLKELLRIFKPSSLYKNSTLIYWASKNWVSTESETVYLDQCKTYKVGEKQRALCFFRNTKS